MKVLRAVSVGLLVLALASLACTCLSLSLRLRGGRPLPISFVTSAALAVGVDLLLCGAAAATLTGWMEELYAAHNITACVVAHWMVRFALTNTGYARLFGERMGSVSPGAHSWLYIFLMLGFLTVYFGICGIVGFQRLFSADSSVFWFFLMLLVPWDMLLLYYFADWCLERVPRIHSSRDLDACSSAFAILLKIRPPGYKEEPSGGMGPGALSGEGDLEGLADAAERDAEGGDGARRASLQGSDISKSESVSAEPLPPRKPRGTLSRSGQVLSSRVELFGCRVSRLGWSMKCLLHIVGNVLACLALHFFGVAISRYDYVPFLVASLFIYFVAEILMLELQT